MESIGAVAEVFDPETDEEPLQEVQPPPIPPRNKGGRPKKHRVVTTTRQEFVDDMAATADESLADDSFAPLFDRGIISENSIVKCRVIRRDPDEGTLGYVDDPTAGDNAIIEQWGGGVFRIEGLNAHGAIKKVRVIKLAGDPIFKSVAAEALWRRSRGLPASAAAPVNPTSNITEILTMQQTAEDKRRSEEREHSRAMRQLEIDAEDRRRKDEDDRLRARNAEAEERDKRRLRDEEDRDKRRRLDDEERERRRAAETVAALQQQQQFMQQTIAMIQASSKQSIELATAQAKPTGGIEETLRTIAMIKDTFAGDGDKGDPEDSTMQTLFKQLPAMLQGAGGAIGSAIREVKGGPAGTAPAQQLAAAPSGGNLLAALPVDHPLVAKLDAVVTKLALQGKDPEVVLGGVADMLLHNLNGNPGAPAATAPVAKPFVAEVPPATASVAPVKVEPPAAFVSKAIKIGFGRKAA